MKNEQFSASEVNQPCLADVPPLSLCSYAVLGIMQSHETAFGGRSINGHCKESFPVEGIIDSVQSDLRKIIMAGDDDYAMAVERRRKFAGWYFYDHFFMKSQIDDKKIFETLKEVYKAAGQMKLFNFEERHYAANLWRNEPSQDTYVEMTEYEGFAYKRGMELRKAGQAFPDYGELMKNPHRLPKTDRPHYMFCGKEKPFVNFKTLYKEDKNGQKLELNTYGMMDKQTDEVYQVLEAEKQYQAAKGGMQKEYDAWKIPREPKTWEALPFLREWDRKYWWRDAGERVSNQVTTDAYIRNYLTSQNCMVCLCVEENDGKLDIQINDGSEKLHINRYVKEISRNDAMKLLNEVLKSIDWKADNEDLAKTVAFEFELGYNDYLKEKKLEGKNGE